MKKLNVILSGVLLMTLFTFVSTNIAQAEVSACSAENPCGTWAVINDSGVVINIIVCQPSVCGSGILGGNRVVLQVPANPTTHTSQGGYYNSEPGKEVTYNEQTNSFNTGSSSFPAPVTRTEVIDTVTLSATINSTSVTFGPNNFVNGQMEFTPVVDTSTGASIYAAQSNGESTTVESFAFATPQTVEQMRASLAEQLVLLRTHLNKLVELLKGWVKN